MRLFEFSRSPSLYHLLGWLIDGCMIWVIRHKRSYIQAKKGISRHKINYIRAKKGIKAKKDITFKEHPLYPDSFVFVVALLHITLYPRRLEVWVIISAKKTFSWRIYLSPRVVYCEGFLSCMQAGCHITFYGSIGPPRGGTLSSNRSVIAQGSGWPV